MSATKQEELKASNKWLALATTMVGTFMSTLNNSIVNIANPTMAASFDVSMAQIQWVATIYLIVTSSMMLLFGRMGDRVGSHRIYITGVALFTVASFACYLADDLMPLLIARAFQGAGAAMSMAVGMGLVATIFPLKQRGRAMGATVVTVGLGSVAGPSVGGLVLAYASWHYIFLLSVPFGLVSFIMAALWLRSPLPKKPEVSIPLLSSLLFAAAVACLIVFLSSGSAGSQWFALAFCLLAAALVMVERRTSSPLFDRTLLKNKRFILGNSIAILTYCAHIMLIFQLPFFLDTVWSLPVGTIGLLMMISALTLAVGGPISGFISDHFGAFKVMIPAMGAMLLSLVCAFFLGSTPSMALFVALMILAGAGMGFFNTPNNSDIMTAAGRENASFASGFVGTNRNLGFCIGTALSAGVFHFGHNIANSFSGLTGIVINTESSLHVFSFVTVLVICVTLVFAGIGICAYLVRSSKKTAVGSAHKSVGNSEE